MLGAASSSILIASLVFLLLCLTGVIERMRFLFSPMIRAWSSLWSVSRCLDSR